MPLLDAVTLQHHKPIDVINHKISKLDSLFSELADVHEEADPSPVELSFKVREEIQRRKAIETRQINLFAGIYSLKSISFRDKTQITQPISLKVDRETGSSGPKLVETYQFTGYLSDDSSQILRLPHEVSINQVQQRVFNSIKALSRQAHYRQFLQEVYFSKLVTRLVVNTFYWCFLDRYQRIDDVQRELFKRISESYVALTYRSMDPRYKETFFKKFADYLAMTIYAIFCACFPDSFQTQFNEGFKEFVCEVCWLWISGKSDLFREQNR